MLAIAAVLIALAFALYAIYKRVMADGVVTLDEVFDAVSDAAESIDEAIEEIQEIQNQDK